MGLTPRHIARPEPTGKRSMVTTIMFALLFIAWVGEAPIKLDMDLYNGLWRSPFSVLGPLLTPIPGISLTPWQLLLVALATFCFGTAAIRLHAREMDRAILVSIASVAVTFLWGLLKGGSAYFAYYQVWHYLAALLIAYMLMSAVRSERDLVLLGKIVVLVALIRATLCIYVFWALMNGKVTQQLQYVTTHDDTLLFVTGIEITTIWALLKGGKAAWWAAILVSSVVVYAIVLNNRRIAWVALALSLPLMYVVIGAGPLRSRINRWAMIVGPLLLVYFVAGTVSDSPVFAPVHALASTGSYRDASSLTREEEIRNLLRTLSDSGNPIFGTGWGRPYDKVESYYSNYDPNWILVLYTPHNSIVGLAAYSGLVGILGIWGVFPVAAFLAARGYRNSTSKVVRTAGMAAIGAIGVYGVQCYGDIGFQSFPGAVILGVALGIAGRVSMWPEAVSSPNIEAARKVDAHSASRRRVGFRPGRIQAPTRRSSH
jgi:hypothetical protein